MRLSGETERPLGERDLSLDTDLLLSLTGERSGEAARSATGDLDGSLIGDLDLDLDFTGEADRSLETDLAGESPPPEPAIGSDLAGDLSSSDIVP